MEVNDVLNTKVFVITPEGKCIRKGDMLGAAEHREHLQDILDILYPHNCASLEINNDGTPLPLGNLLRMLGNVVILNSPTFYAGIASKYLIVLAPISKTEIQSIVLRYYLEYFKDYKLDFSSTMPCSFNYTAMDGFDTTNDTLTPLEAYDKHILKLTKKSAS